MTGYFALGHGIRAGPNRSIRQIVRLVSWKPEVAQVVKGRSGFLPLTVEQTRVSPVHIAASCTRINTRMTLSRIALITAASGFTGFGIACLVRPESMLKRVDVRAQSARGTTELRAMYGGLELGLGAFFAIAAAKPEWSRPALLAQTLGLGALAASRLAGILSDHPRGSLMKALFAAESSAAGLGAAALIRKREVFEN